MFRNVEAFIRRGYPIAAYRLRPRFPSDCRPQLVLEVDITTEHYFMVRQLLISTSYGLVYA